MSLLKRMLMSVHSNVDKALISIEDHEAVIDAALKSSRESLVKAQLRLTTLERDGKKQSGHITDLNTEIQLWQERALSCADVDRDKALKCLQRKHQRQAALAVAEAQWQQHNNVVEKVRATVNEAAEQVTALQHQRNQMRSREAAAEAGRLATSLDSRMNNEVTSAIERWEIKVGQTEIQLDTSTALETTTDTFADDFKNLEGKRQLEAELDQLIAAGARHD